MQCDGIENTEHSSSIKSSRSRDAPKFAGELHAAEVMHTGAHDEKGYGHSTSGRGHACAAGGVQAGGGVGALRGCQGPQSSKGQSSSRGQSAECVGGLHCALAGWPRAPLQPAGAPPLSSRVCTAKLIAMTDSSQAGFVAPTASCPFPWFCSHGKISQLACVGVL